MGYRKTVKVLPAPTLFFSLNLHRSLQLGCLLNISMCQVSSRFLKFVRERPRSVCESRLTSSLTQSVRAESSGRISVGSKYLFCSANGLKLPTTASLVYCSGQIAAQGDGTNKKLLEGSIADKTAFILDNLEKVLKAGGSSLNQVSLTVDSESICKL